MASSKSEVGNEKRRTLLSCLAEARKHSKPERQTSLEWCQRNKGGCFTLFSWLVHMIENFQDKNFTLTHTLKLCLKASKNLKIVVLTKAQSREVNATCGTTFTPESNCQVLRDGWKADSFERCGARGEHQDLPKEGEDWWTHVTGAGTLNCLQEAGGIVRSQAKNCSPATTHLYPKTELRWSQTVHSLRCLAEASINPL